MQGLYSPRGLDGYSRGKWGVAGRIPLYRGPILPPPPAASQGPRATARPEPVA
jgi:hypothetical protein